MQLLLSDLHKQTLEANGFDWKAILAKVKVALPLLIAIAEAFLADKPLMQTAPVGCDLKTQLQHVLHSQLAASHALCEAICSCDGGDNA